MSNTKRSNDTDIDIIRLDEVGSDNHDATSTKDKDIISRYDYESIDERYRASGLSLKKFAQKEGLDYDKLRNGIYNDRKRRAKDDKLEIIKLKDDDSFKDDTGILDISINDIKVKLSYKSQIELIELLKVLRYV